MHTTQDNILRPDPLPHDDRVLIEAYMEVGIALDRLPYSPAFDRLFDRVRGALSVKDDAESRNLIFQRLTNLRKSGKLPRLDRPESSTDLLEF